MATTDIIFENVELRWKNFSGRTDDFNPPVGLDNNGNRIGKRYFNIVLTEEQAEKLRGIELATKTGDVVTGANVKTHLPKNGEGDPMYTLKVLFGEHPPESMYRIIPKGKMPLTMDTIGGLDREVIEKAKVVVTLSPYKRPGNAGIAAYVKKLAVWIKEDTFDNDLNDIPTIGGGIYTGDPGSPTEDDDEHLPF